MSTPQTPTSFLSSHRIEALHDGVFAIVMTLLVLELKIPEHSVNVSEYLLEQWPIMLAYIASFTVLGIYWIGQHLQFNFIEYADRVFLWLNMLFLFLVSLLPFTTGILGRQFDQQPAVLLYGANLVAIGVVAYIAWSYAAYHHRLVDHATPDKVITDVKRRILFAPIICLIAMTVSFVSIPLSLILFLIIPPFYIVPGRVDRFWKREAVPHEH